MHNSGEMTLKGCILLLSIVSFGHEVEDIAISTPEIIQLLNSMKGPSVTTLKAKIWLRQEKIMKLNLQEIFVGSKDLTGCPERLFLIMRENLKCPTWARKIRPFLDVLDFRYKLAEDERLLKSFISKNCTWLDGMIARSCNEGKISVEFESFAKIIDNCYLEHQRARGRNTSLFKRSQVISFS